jgi:hypothetical protein
MTATATAEPTAEQKIAAAWAKAKALLESLPANKRGEYKLMFKNEDRIDRKAVGPVTLSTDALSMKMREFGEELEGEIDFGWQFQSYAKKLAKALGVRFESF